MPIQLKDYIQFKRNPSLGIYQIIESAKQEAREIAKMILEKELARIEAEFDRKFQDFMESGKGERIIERVIGDTDIAGAIIKTGLTIKGKDGDDGYTPKKGIDYFDGKKGDNGKKGDDGYTPIKGIDYFDGAKGDKGNDGSPDTPQQISSKLNTLEEKLEISVIKGLKKALERIKSGVGRKVGGGMGNPIHQSFSGDGSTTSFILTYGVAADGNAIIVRYQGQTQDMTTHYTISGRTLSLTFTPENGTTISVTYWRA